MTNFPIDKFKNLETPFYYYDTKLLKDTLNIVKQCSEKYNFHIHYAIKANYNPKLLQIIKEYGFGVDCVSGGEIDTALNNGFKADKIMFAGVGKTDKEINSALQSNIFCFNVESIPELMNINELAEKQGKVANIAVRINPEVNAHTHQYISTGLKENKFGINMEFIPAFVKTALTLPNINLCGIHFHIGSQITETEPFEKLCSRINEILGIITNLGAKITIIDVGGGLGIDYNNPKQNSIPDFEGYFKIFHDHLKIEEGQEIHFEPGRSIVGQCGTLISRVLYVKEGSEKKFIIIDAGMNDLIRPALYQAHHHIENLTADNSMIDDIYDVVGPVCESSDCFSNDERLPISHRRDLIAIYSAGAYGEVMSSTYNCRDLSKSILDYEI